MTEDDHFERVAAAYESLRTTDEAPVCAIGQFLPGRPAADVQAGHRTAWQELADRAYRRLVGGAQRFICGGNPFEMIAHGHVRHLRSGTR